MASIGPNEPCPCGSGRKFKKCCNGVEKRQAPPAPYTRDERERAIRKALKAVAAVVPAEERESIREEFGGPDASVLGELDDFARTMSFNVYWNWMLVDYDRPDGTTIVQELFTKPRFDAGEKAYLETLRVTRMRLWRVTGVVAGESVTVRDAFDDGVLTIRERSASQTLEPGDLLAARIVAAGASGFPEFEDILVIAGVDRDAFLAEMRAEWEASVAQGPDSVDAFLSVLPMGAHEHWVYSVLDPALPTLVNNDGDEMVVTRHTFRMKDRKALEVVLDDAGGEGIRREGGGRWAWVGRATREHALGDDVHLSAFEAKRTNFTIEANSIQRADRARELVERLAGHLLEHKATTHSDVQKLLRDRLAKGGADTSEEPATDLSEEQVAAFEKAAQEMLDRHYRDWVDQPVPALGGLSPREAAKAPARRRAVTELIEGIGANSARLPGGRRVSYDTSWMWAELGLERPAD
jgi:hypothetical protein